MKKTLILTIALLVVASVAGAQISTSDHDFSTETWNSTGEICIVCHTPHDGTTGFVAPLWNHEVSTATYTMYSSDTLDGAIGTEPGDISKACLSCHDGTVALENFGGSTGGTNFIDAGHQVGPDLSTEHPVNVDYGTDVDLNPDTTAYGQKTIADFLFANKVECASCHDVHNKFGNSDLLIEDNAASALCLTCHIK